jgi:hypothetical protein
MRQKLLRFKISSNEILPGNKFQVSGFQAMNEYADAEICRRRN